MKEAGPLLRGVKTLFRGLSALYTGIINFVLGTPENLSKYAGKITFVSTGKNLSDHTPK